jgi:hypothetical protein
VPDAATEPHPLDPVQTVFNQETQRATRMSTASVSRAAACLAGALLAVALCPPKAMAMAKAGAEFDRTAACVAVMKPRLATLADRYRAGDDAVKDELTSLAERSFALVGAAYEAGLRKAEAEQRLAAAEAAQKTAPAATLDRLMTACRAEGATVLANANPVERALVKSAARARIMRLRER